MKLLALITLLSLPLSALPLDNPWDASFFCRGQGVVCDCIALRDLVACDQLDFIRMGFYGDYVFNRHLRHDGRSLRRVQLNTNAAFIGFNFCNALELFTTLGATRAVFESPGSAFQLVNGYNHPIQITTETDFSWSVGARGTIWHCGPIAIGGEAQYFYTNPNISSIYSMGQETDPVYYPPNGIHFKYQEWQLGVGTSYQICFSQGWAAFPYIGATWSHPWVDMGEARLAIGGGNSIFFDVLKSQRSWGYALGFTLTACDRLSFDVEGRFVSESALHFELAARF